MVIPVEQQTSKIFNIKNLYRFPKDCEDIADNMVKKFKGVPGDAMTVSQNVVTFATELYKVALFEDDEGGQEIDG